MGRYLPTALAQYELAWKMLVGAERGLVDLDLIDVGCTAISPDDPALMIVLKDKTFENTADFVQALENNVSVAFGVAAICLNRAREEAGLLLPNPIVSEIDQFVSISYQIRNAFSHDISEPKWNITNPRYRRSYRFGGIEIDLTDVEHQTPFEWEHIGGPDTIYHMYDYYRDHIAQGLPE